MFTKSLATVVAALLGLGLSISAISPAQADDVAPPDAAVATAPPAADEPVADAPADEASVTPTPSATEPVDQPRVVEAPPTAPARRAATTSYPVATGYGVALYLYEKKNPLQGASWENSGRQTLIIQDVDNTSPESNVYWETYPLALPSGVCGTGWAVQQDKVSFTGSFVFPPFIEYPEDNIGWLPIYAAQHRDLTELTTVPPCPEPTSTQPSCTAAGSYTLPDLAGVTWTVNGVAKPAGSYPANPGDNLVIKASASASGVLVGAVRDSYTGKWTLTWNRTFSFPDCRAPQLEGSITSVCVNDVPMVRYSVTLVDPDQQSTGDQAVLRLTDGTSVYTYSPALGTIHDGETLSGDLLWPGASTDPITGEADGWPGWEQVGGVWQETPGNFAWTRAGVAATISVNPEVSAELSYPPGDPDCYPGPREVTPTVTTTDASCEVDGSFTLPDIEGIEWRVNGDVTPAGTYPGGTPGTQDVTATVVGPFVLAAGARTSWTLEFPAIAGCLTLEGSAVSGTCEADSPWISYAVTLTDPFDQTTGYDAELIMTGAPGEQVAIPLGTIDPTTMTLTGKVLWPGASVDPVTGVANGWPGWEQVAGVWQPTTGNYAWTRSITSAVLSVNPSMTVTLSYPPATPSCALMPPQDPPTLGIFPTSATLSEQCTADGRGILTLGQVDGVSFFEDVNYFIDGVPATSSTVYLAPGTYSITVTTKSPTDGLDGPTSWSLVVTGDQVCGELTTLALTGWSAGGWLAAVAALLALGAGAVVASRLRFRRA